MFSVASVSLFVRPVRVLTFECLGLQTSFLVHWYIFKITRSGSSIKVKSQGQGHTSVTKCTQDASFDWKTILLNMFIFIALLGRNVKGAGHNCISTMFKIIT